VSRPAYHVDVATTAIPAAIAQPPGGIQTAGFPAHSKFASAWANWLFNFLGGWTRELDQSCLRAVDAITSNATALLLKGSGSGFALEENAGLANLGLTSGGAYLILGRRVDLEESAVVTKYPTGWTLPNNSTVYAHARQETSAGGSSTGELLLSTNPVEAGYLPIWQGETDGTDLTSQVSLADDAAQWLLPVDFLDRVSITDTNDEVAFRVTAANTIVPAFVLNSATPGGTGIQVTPGANAVGVDVQLGAGSGSAFSANCTASLIDSAGIRIAADAASLSDGVVVTLANTTHGSGVIITTASPEPGINIVGSGVTTGYALQTTGTEGLNITPKSLSTGITTRSGSSGSGSAINAILQNTSGAAVTASTTSGGGTAVRASALGTATGVVATAVNNPAGTFDSSGSGAALTATGAGTGAGAVVSAAVNAALVVSQTGNGANGNYVAVFSPDITSPRKAAMTIIPGNADPSDPASNGDITFSSAKGLLLGEETDNTWRSAWHSLGGYACAYGQFANRTTPAGNSGYLTVGTITTTNNGDKIKRANSVVLLRLLFSMRTMNVSVDTLLSIRITDTTAANVVFERTGSGGGDTSAYFVPAFATIQHPLLYWVPGPAIEFPVTVPATGTRTYEVAIATPAAYSPVRVRDMTMSFVGTVA
jgi:hypothetical protein